MNMLVNSAHGSNASPPLTNWYVNGCWICRLRKKKCDETRPTCQQCRNLKIQCDGYGVAQPAWMKDPEAAKVKKDEIKLQIGKRCRRKRKNRGSTQLDNREDMFGFETIDGGILILKPFNETGKSNPQAVEMLDSPHPPLGCFRCPVRNSFARSEHPPSDYGLLDGRTGKPLLENIRSGVLLVTTPPLWKPLKSICTRTKEEETFNNEYDIIIASFMSSNSQALGPLETSDYPTSEMKLIKNYIRNVPPTLSNWKPHLEAAIECLVQMDLLNKPIHTATTQFMMSRVIWLDILSALTLGRAPQLWANYREILSRPVHERSYCGLLEMTGCDDTVLFLISEVMCVEDYKFRSFDDGVLSWTRGRSRAMELDTRLRDRDLPVTVQLPPSPEPPEASLQSHDDYDSDDDTNSYFLSPSPSWTTSSPRSPLAEYESPHHPFTSPGPNVEASIWTPPSSSTESVLTIREQSVLDCADYSSEYEIPPEAIPDQVPIRLNRTIMWPLLVGGCIAIEPQDREYFASRCTCGGVLSGVAAIMLEVWKRSDERDLKHGVGRGQEVHWRTVMRDLGMELLLV
ncbi:uncharacterized protein H6S33_011754 [Morchella sextelata]|uniref:uncharacterized protein n=1 Tax=Morchella sextelata TaxID=1174677 RepID=UPI001D057121|nr:uncharacterized protein H6S33_011754 [Morchella sextelata]KAH0610227.1 hypothetical protein H6S33_011754 [Morchella sextelata]